MKSLLVILIACTGIACNKSFKKVNFKSYVYNGTSQRKITYIAYLPKNFIRVFVEEAGGEIGICKRYYYHDSAIIYLSDDHLVSPNYENILKAGYSERKFKFTKTLNASIHDTLVLASSNDKKLYWTEVFIGKACIGYLNVTEDKKHLFDKSVSTFKKR